MTANSEHVEIGLDPELDLVLERVVDVRPELIWKAWTTPEHLKPWFCPRPWSITDCRIDLRPGGEFFFTMRSPDSKEFPNAGCYLELVENRKLSWTTALGPGYRPVSLPVHAENKGAPPFHFTAVLTFTPEGNGTRYRALAMHARSADRDVHEEMGFSEGWGVCLDQLVEYVKGW